MNEVLVSVIIPAYNQGHYLGEAIDSALNQTVAMRESGKVEVIVVDDEAIDDSAQVAQSYGERIRYIWQPNQGLAGARNTGIRLARGVFIALLDSDDRWLPDYLEKMLRLAQQEPEAAVYYCGIQYINHEGRALPQSAVRIVPPEEMYFSTLRANFLTNTASLIRRQALIDVGCYDLAFRRLQDWELWIRMLRSGYRFVGLPECLVQYRLHENSLSIDGSGGRKAALALAMKNYGPDDGLYARWTPEKRRAYGGVYRYHALSLIMRERDWLAATPYVQLAFLADPDLARDIDFYYELALGYQPEGRRGLADDPLSGDRTLILEDNSRQVEALLGRVFQPSQGAELQRLRADASASAWHALGIAAYNTGHLGLARRWLGRALAARPGLAGKPGVVAAFAKSLLGGELLTALRRLKNAVRKAVARRPAAHSTRTV